MKKFMITFLYMFFGLDFVFGAETDLKIVYTANTIGIIRPCPV